MVGLASVHQILGRDGIACVEGFLSVVELDVLQDECSTLVELRSECYADDHSAATHRGCIFEPSPQPSSRSSPESQTLAAYLQQRDFCPCSPGALRILLGQKMRQLVQACLGCPGYLFNEQYIAKPCQSPASAFCWHRDSDWLRGPQKGGGWPDYISVWVALDDMTEGNGTLRVLKGSHRQPGGMAEPGWHDSGQVMPSQVVPSQVQPKAGQDLPVRAGTAVVLDCRVLHCSGPNLSRHWRRAWMPQFSRGVIRDAASSEAMAFAVPVADAAAWAGLDGSQERMGM